MNKLTLAVCVTTALTASVAGTVLAQQARGGAVRQAQQSLRGTAAVRGHAPDF